MKKLEWQLLDTRRVIDDGWFTLRKDSCLLPGGQVIEDFYGVEARPWVCVVAQTVDGQLVLERQYRQGLGRVMLEVPGGVMDREDGAAEVAARRELLEETGYGGGTWMETGQACPDPGLMSNTMFCFLATGVELQAPQALDSTETLEVLLMPFEEAIRRAKLGEFEHATHLSAIFYALAALGKI